MYYVQNQSPSSRRAPLQLQGDLPVAELDLGVNDELIRAEKPLRYQLTVELLHEAVLAMGSLGLPLECECARCLKPFTSELKLDHWAVHLPLEGEEKVAVDNDCVDLTPWVREDILLNFPQRLLCRPDCAGLKTKTVRKPRAVKTPALDVWAKLDKLKIK
jgi:uncharacterized protein